jgi:hypothetical protein
MELRLIQFNDHRLAPLGDVELTRSIRSALEELDASAQSLAEAITSFMKCYASEESFKFEKRAVLDRDWVCVAHIGSIPNPDDYLSINITTNRC